MHKWHTLPGDEALVKKAMNKKPKFKVGDRVHDSNAFGDGIGVIEEVKRYGPYESPMCWYGGYLYKHSGRGEALPKFTYGEALEKVR